MTPRASFARQCQMSIETIRVQYNDVIARLVRELRPDFEDGRPDEAWLESIVHRRLLGTTTRCSTTTRRRRSLSSSRPSRPSLSWNPSISFRGP